MSARGVIQVIECGPGKVLAGLTKRIDDQLQSMALMDDASLMEVMQTLKPR
jgi:[acyl-carrier-protein] S-malonyltransferase